MLALKRALTLHKAIGNRARSQFIGSGICGLPRNRMSQKEKIFLTCCLFGFWLPYPLWVVFNLDSYKAPS